MLCSHFLTFPLLIPHLPVLLHSYSTRPARLLNHWPRFSDPRLSSLSLLSPFELTVLQGPSVTQRWASDQSRPQPGASRQTRAWRQHVQEGDPQHAGKKTHRKTSDMEGKRSNSQMFKTETDVAFTYYNSNDTWSWTVKFVLVFSCSIYETPGNDTFLLFQLRLFGNSSLLKGKDRWFLFYFAASLPRCLFLLH